MMDLGSQRGPLYIMDTATSVECGREVRFRRSLRSLVECMVPCCGFQPSDSLSSDTESLSTTTTTHGSTTTTVTGTFFGYRKGRVSFCLQHDTRSSPLLLLEFAVPTAYLAREMQYGLLRIALECDRSSSSNCCSLYNVPVWSMYCNGRKVGYAMRRHMTVPDVTVLQLMQSVSVGAGVLPVAPKPHEDGDLMYLRATFERVIGSVDSESFHMMNPVGSSGQELSLFLLRSS